MVTSVNKDKPNNLIDRLIIAYHNDNTPLAYKNNFNKPFKPYFYYIDSFGIGNITEIAIYLLQDFTLLEIKELRKLLAQEVFKYGQLKLTAIKQHYPSVTTKAFISQTDLLVNYLDTNKKKQTYRMTTKKIVKPIHLYAVLSLKFIQRVLKKLEYKKYNDPIHLLLGSEISPLTHYDYSNIAKQLVHAMGCLTNGVSMHANLYQTELNDHQQRQHQIIKKKMAPLQTKLQANKQKQQKIIEFAKTIWEIDSKQQLLRMKDIIEIINRLLLEDITVPRPIPTDESIKKWIKAMSPDYARRSGRKSKKNTPLIENYKEQVIKKLSTKSK